MTRRRERSGTGADVIGRHVTKQSPVVERPCAGCPFLRHGGVKGLRPGRVTEALEADGHFLCHKTTRETGNGTDRVCAGWAAVLVKQGYGGQMFRILGRLGAFAHIENATWLSEVVDDAEEAEEVQAR